MQRALDLALGARAAGTAVHVHGADQLGDFTVFVVNDFFAADDVGPFEAHFAAGGEAEELLGRVFHEVLTVDVEDVAHVQRARAHLGMVGMILHGDLVHEALGPVGERHLERMEYSHGARRAAAQILAHTVFEQSQIHRGIGLGHAHAAEEILDGGGAVTAAAHSGEGGHAGIVPAGDHALLHEAAQMALGHHCAGEVEAGKLDLARRVFKTGFAHDPIVQGAMDLVFQRAERVRDALDGVLQGVLEIVHRVDAPVVARAVVVAAQDAVERGIAHQHVGRGHVDLGAQNARAVREFAIAHALEEIKVLLDAAVAVGAVDAGSGEGAAVFAHLLAGLIVHVSHALADEVACDLVELFKEIRGEVQFVPRKAQPFNVVLDVFDEHRVLLGGVGVVKAQVALAAVLFGNAKVYAQGLGVTDVQKAVRLGWKARAHVVVATAGEVLVDKFLDKVGGAPLLRHIHDLLVVARRNDVFIIPRPRPKEQRFSGKMCARETDKASPARIAEVQRGPV